MEARKLALVGGPDIDSRIELMHYFERDFQVLAVGSESTLVEQFTGAGFHYYWYHLARHVSPVADFRSFAQLFRIFRRERPEIVHAFDTKPCVLARLAARLAGVPIVVGTLTGLGSLYVNESVGVRVVRMIYERLQSFSCHVSDFTTFHNHEDAQYFLDRRLAPAKRTVVIPGSGVRTDIFSREAVSPADIQQARAQLGLAQEHQVITMISRLLRTKGVLEFAEAAQIVQQRQPQTRFLLVGPSDDDSIDRLTPAELAKLQQAVNWPGPRRDIPVVLALSDVFVLPSYREGMPRVLLEAASMGLPIVTADSPGCREVVEHGVNGFLVPVRDPEALAEAIMRLVDDPSLRQRFGQESRRRAAARFDLAVVAQQLGLLYTRLLTDKGSLPRTKT